VLQYPQASLVLNKWLTLLPEAKVIFVFRPMEESVNSQIRNWWKDRPCKFLVRWIYRYERLRGYLAMRNLSIPVCFVTFQELKETKDFYFPRSWGWEQKGDETVSPKNCCWSPVKK
jgi:hypothetical protein